MVVGGALGRDGEGRGGGEGHARRHVMGRDGGVHYSDGGGRDREAQGGGGWGWQTDTCVNWDAFKYMRHFKPVGHNKYLTISDMEGVQQAALD